MTLRVTRSQRSHDGRNACAGEMREWCGRRERSERATVAYSTGVSRVAAWHYALSPQRSVSGVEDPGGVGAVRTCGTMSHHDGIIILPLSRLSFIVAAAVVVAMRGEIRAEKVPAPMVLRLSLNSERAGEITIEGMPRSAERYRRIFAARSPSTPGMEVFPGLEEGCIKKGRSHANLAGTGPEVCGGRKPS